MGVVQCRRWWGARVVDGCEQDKQGRGGACWKRWKGWVVTGEHLVRL